MTAPSRWVLMNPGPANTTETVRAALDTGDLCHREPEFLDRMARVRAGLVRLSGATPATHAAVLLTGSGTTAVEATIASAVPEGGRLLVVDNGVYGDRMARIAAAHRIDHVRLSSPPTEPVAATRVAAALDADLAIDHVAVVHHETTTGLLNPVAAIAAAVADRGRRLIVDAMSSFGGEPIDLSATPIDYLVASSNKCLMGLPGVAFVIARRRALDGLLGTRPRSVALDLVLHFVRQEAGDTPFTPAIQIVAALEQAIAEAEAETLAGRQARWRAASDALREGMDRLGLRPLLTDPTHRSRTLTTYRLPEGVAYDALHDALKERGYIIYAGQGDLARTCFRLATMGTFDADLAGRFLADLEAVLAGLR